MSVWRKTESRDSERQNNYIIIKKEEVGSLTRYWFRDKLFEVSKGGEWRIGVF